MPIVVPALTGHPFVLCSSFPDSSPPSRSLHSETADDVHGCYQDVIAQMLQEQQRARASRSELLNAQAAHLTQIGDQWPAFQQLQVIFFVSDEDVRELLPNTELCILCGLRVVA